VSAHVSLPTAVLSQALVDAIGDRRVRAGVFTTFSFDPAFFELHVLPLLFDQSFSQVDKIRRIQLEDALREVEVLAVYYDRRALAQDAEPAQLDYDRIDVSRSHGCFHPKVVLLLLEETEGEEAKRSLLVSIQSANLTRAGWWENAECGHIEEIHSTEVSEDRISFRNDLMALLRQVRASAPPDEEHPALDLIQSFLRRETTTRTFTNASSKGRYFTRIFCGQDHQDFSAWLVDLGLARQEWNLEIVSPFFDAKGAAPLQRLVESLEPRETRVYLPRELDGKASVSEEAFAVVQEWAHWADLPSALLARGRDGGSERLPPRRAHAKLYRFWHRDGRDILITGSVNLTSAAHGHWAAGNLEAAFLVDVTDEKLSRRWFLSKLDTEPTEFVDAHSAESDASGPVPIALSLRFDWARRELDYRVQEETPSPFQLHEISGISISAIKKPKLGSWISLGPEIGKQFADILRSNSFIRVEHAGGSWRVLIREVNMGHRPSLLTQLTAEEILQYWSLLNPEQRAVFLEERLGLDAQLEGLVVTRPNALRSNGTMFDRFAGIYHAFGCLLRYIGDATEDGRAKEAAARLLGAKYDSLPCLLEKTLEAKDPDPIGQYVTFLCAKQTLDAARHGHPELFEGGESHTRVLDALLARLPDLRHRVAEDGLEDADAFLDWFEPAFLGDLSAGSR